jgi:hypothetical protein
MARVLIYDRVKYDFVIARRVTFDDVETLIDDLKTGESNSSIMSQLKIWGDDYRNIFTTDSIQKVEIHYDKYGEMSSKYNHMIIWANRCHMRIQLTHNQLQQAEKRMRELPYPIKYY